MNFYPRYIGDYSRDTGELSMVDHGAYALLLDAYYATERPLPNDWPSLFRITGALSKLERAAVQRTADRFFPVGPDGLRHNKRADAEIVKGRQRIDKARRNGSHGGRPPKPSGQPTGNPAGSVRETQRVNSPSPEPEPTPERSTAKQQAAGAREGDAELRVALTRPVNRALLERYGEDTNPLLPTSGGATRLLTVVREHEIPLDFAEAELYAAALRCPERPRTLAYFAGGLLEAWQRSEARTAAQSGVAPTAPAARATRRPTIGETAYATGLAALGVTPVPRPAT